MVQSPSKDFSTKTVHELTQGKVSVADDAVEHITNFYSHHADKRKAFWKRVAELANNMLEGDWKPVRREVDVHRGRIGDYRIFARRLQDGRYQITKILRRGETGWSES